MAEWMKLEALAAKALWPVVPAPGAPAAALGDPPELLDVDVDQLAGALALVAHPADRPPAHRLAGEGVEL